MWMCCWWRCSHRRAERVPDLTWVDLDGDRCRLRAESLEDDATVIASILAMESDDGDEAEVYVTEGQARDLIDWLTEALAAGAERRDAS